MASFLYSLSYAQDPRLFENTWYLYSVKANDFDPNYLVSEIEPQIIPTIFIEENLNFNGAGACNTFTGQYEYNSTVNEMNTLIFTDSGEDCGVQIHNSFEDGYFAFISSGFWISISEDNSGLILNLENALAGYAVFKTYPLSVSTFLDNFLQIYPNPVQETLFLNISRNFDYLFVKIFNPGGQLLKTQALNNETQTSLDVSNLSSGIYFLHIEDKNGRIEVKKFIKG